MVRVVCADFYCYVSTGPLRQTQRSRSQSFVNGGRQGVNKKVKIFHFQMDDGRITRDTGPL
jgi:ureidoglycolate hydrolase